MTFEPVDCVGEARRFTRVVERSDRLQAAILTPQAGSRPVWLDRLRMAASFLEPPDPEEVSGSGFGATVNYVDLGGLRDWISDVIGDVELAAEIDDVLADEKPYGIALRELHPLMEQRLAQCDELADGASVIEAAEQVAVE